MERSIVTSCIINTATQAILSMECWSLDARIIILLLKPYTNSYWIESLVILLFYRKTETIQGPRHYENYT